MALIQTIRKRGSIVLILMIGLGLVAFILMDMTSGQQSVFGSNQTAMAEINGEKLDINEFSRTEQLLYGGGGGDMYANRNQLWDFYVQKFLVEDEADEIGLGVSRDELIDLQFGNNLSPIITSRFIDQGTGQVNRELLNSYKSAIENNQLDPQTRQFWAHQEKEIIQQRLADKITDIATKGMYVPTWMAEMIGNDQNQKLDFAYVQIPFDNIANTEVTLSDADYQAYLNENAGQFEVEDELRRLDYLVLDVIPTSADSAAIRSDMDSLMIEFAAAEDDSTFVSDYYGSFDVAYLREAQLPVNIKDTISSMAVGEVYGPYVESGFYRAAKVVDRMVIPDSVRSRHILLRANPGNQPEVNQAFRTIDSLKTLIESGTHRFDSLAAAFGQDGTAASGGDLGFTAEASEIQRQGQQGGMVKPFNDLIFFKAEPGKLYVIGTQFGVHLVEVTDRKYINNEEGVRIAYMGKPIEPSDDTRAAVENDALDISENYTTLDALAQLVAERSDLSLETTGGLTRNAFQIAGLQGSQSMRDMIRWAFGDDPNLGMPNVGEVSPELYVFQDQTFFYTNKYVIAGLKSIQSPGKPTVDDVRADLEPLVMNEKKAEIIKQRIGSETNLAAIAQMFSAKVDTANNVTFHNGFIPGMGAEPAVIGAAFQQDLNQTSAPVVGNTGVFVVMPTYKPSADPNFNIPQIKRQQISALQSQVRARLLNALQKNIDIEDNRARFY